MARILPFFLLLCAFAPFSLAAQTTEPIIYEGLVLRVVDLGERELPQLGVTTHSQELQVKLLGENAPDEMITLQNDYIQVSEGDRIFVRSTFNEFTNQTDYGIVEVKRSNALLFLFALFALVIIGFGGWQGVRSLLSLGASLFIILYLMVPALASGAPPILTSVGIAFLVMFGAVFFTHGFNYKSLAAFVGAIVAVFFTGLLAWVMVDVAMLTGFSSDESVYLNINTGGTLNFAGLLLGGIIIGILGVLDDIAITQVAVTSELLARRGKESHKSIFMSAMRVGREHVAALVNTLVLAYTGAALPLLLWVASAGSDYMVAINQEVFTVEIVRALVGSIGLVMTVPLTTALAMYLLRNRSHEELEEIAHSGHSH